MKIKHFNCQPITGSTKFKFPKYNLVRYTFSLITLLTLLFLPHSTYGQDSPIMASVNGTQFSTDELVILTVTVVDASAQQPRPILPRLDGLAVIDLDIATDVSIIDGNIHTEVTYTYQLQPRRTGILTIPPVTVKIDGQIHKAPPLSINVSQGAAPVPSPGNEVNPLNISPPAELNGQDFFIESLVDLQRPYLSQQIIHTFRFYQAIQLFREPRYDEPRFAGFETIGLPVREYNLDIADRTYLITEIRTALFPKNLGNITINSTRLLLAGNIYQEPVEMYTAPVIVEVQPLPDNAPPGFKGAVGQYEIEAQFSPQVAILNQPSTFYVTVSGTGNIHTLPEPIWPELDGWRAYDTLTGLTTDMNAEGLMTGTRVFERLVIPNEVGDHIISNVTLVYFDPLAAEYRSISTEPISVKVIPPPTPAPATATAVAAIPTATPVSASANIDIPAPVEEDVNRVSSDSRRSGLRLVLPVLGVLFFGLCGSIFAATVVGVGGLLWWQQQQGRLENSNRKVKTLQQPSQKIHPALAVAMRENDDNYRAVAQALNTYLESLLATSVNGLTRTELAHRLREYGIDESLIERVEDCLVQSEMGRFGPTTSDAGWSLMAATDELLIELDGAVGR